MRLNRSKCARAGGVYIAVLGTALMVSVLAMSSLVLQRVQNRQLSATTDMRQAQLNAETAVELGMLILQDESNWRTARTHGRWFTGRSSGAVATGTCSLDVLDTLDSNLADDDYEPVVLVGIGNQGQAEQRIKVTIDPLKQPLDCLKSAVAAGDLIDLQSDTLRSNGLITASQVAANSSSIYGKVEAVTISGSTYNGTTTQVTASQRPDMPDWSTAFDYYHTNATTISINDLPSVTPNLGRNTSFDANADYWTGAGIGLPTATITRETNIAGHAACLRVHNRSAMTAGASQYIDTFVKPGVSYNFSLQIYVTSSWGNAFRIKLSTKGTAAAQTNASSLLVVLQDGDWHDVSGTVTAPAWSGNLEYARLTIDTDAPGSDNSFYIDNLTIGENTTGRFIYRRVLSPGVNPFGSGTTNAQGIYKIDCGGQRLIIERSRISGTLLVINPGANSCVGDGPIHWAPFVAGYPALLVDADVAANADFSIRATNRALNEKENGVNYNPAGSSHADLGQDADTIDIYRSQITGLIAIEDDLTFQNTPLIRGQIIVGDDIANSSGALDVEYQPDSLLNPPPGFLAPKSYARRAGSSTKAVLP